MPETERNQCEPKPPYLPPRLELAGELLPLADGDRLVGRLIDQDSLIAASASSISLTQVRITGGSWASAKLPKAQMLDVSFEKADLSTLLLMEAGLERVAFERCRLTGLQLGETRLEHVRFTGCKLNLAALRYSSFAHVVFEDCDLRGADFSGSNLKHVSFSGSDLSDAVFERCTCEDVDLRRAKLVGLKSLRGLEGSTIDGVQMIELAPLMAAVLRLSVQEQA